MLAPFRPIPPEDPAIYAKHGFNYCHEIIFVNGQWSRAWDTRKIAESFYENSLGCVAGTVQTTLYKEIDGAAVVVRRSTPNPQLKFDFRA